jgi:cholesterol oxidase
MTDYDFVIIGSGFGGSVSALRLTEKGYKVLVIEKGKRYAAEDFPKSNWNVKKWFWMPALRFFGFFKLTFFRHVTVLSGVGVGGGSLVYANTLQKPKKEFFNSGSWKGLADWEEELNPYYDEVLRMLGAAPNPRMETGDLALKALAKKYGAENRFAPTNVAVYFNEDKTPRDPYFNGAGPLRVPCDFCGACMIGCRNNSKNTLDKNYLYFAEKKGAEVWDEKEVIKIKPSEKGGYEITWRNSTALVKKQGKVKTRGVVLAGGVLGTLKLLTKLKESVLPNLSDKLGEDIRTNSESLLGVISFDKNKIFSDGVAIGSIFHVDEKTSVEPVRYPSGSGFWRTMMMPSVKGGNFLTRIFKIVLDYFVHPVKNLRALFVKDFAAKTQILLFMQTINTKLKFTRGIFGLKSTHSSGEKPSAFIPQAKKIANDYAEIVNGKPYALLTESVAGIPTTAHILGGCVIGANEKDGVIDKNHKVFGYENFYVCDGSAISANPGVNPSLTIAAMTERAMSKIPPKKNYKK